MSRPGPKIPPLSLTDAQRAVLEGWVRRRTTAHALALRSRIVLECADGHSIMAVSRRLGITADTVRTWRRRFLERGLDGLSDEPRPGVPRKITDADVERVIVKTLEEKPKNATHWSTRSMAAATGMSQSAISRIWRGVALAPHPPQTFKLSTDPLFIDKVRDVVGLYLDPPEEALVLCVDEQSRIQALHRSAPPPRRADGARGPRPPQPRLRPRRHPHPVRGAGGRHREGDRFPAPTAPGRGVQEVPGQARQGSSRRPRRASDPGQLRHPQAARGQAVAAGTPALPPALHADQFVLAEPGGAVVRRADAEEAQARRPPLRPSPRTRHPNLARRLERASKALRLDQDRRRDPRQSRRLLPTNLRLRSLGPVRRIFVDQPAASGAGDRK